MNAPHCSDTRMLSDFISYQFCALLQSSGTRTDICDDLIHNLGHALLGLYFRPYTRSFTLDHTDALAWTSMKQKRNNTTMTRNNTRKREVCATSHAKLLGRDHRHSGSAHAEAKWTHAGARCELLAMSRACSQDHHMSQDLGDLVSSLVSNSPRGTEPVHDGEKCELSA